MLILNLTGGNGTKNFNTMAAINIDPNATTGYDQNFDATHLSNAIGNAEIFTMASNTKLKINSIPPVSGSYTVPVGVKSAHNGIYTISPINISNFAAGACIQLHDLVTNSVHDLRTGSYNFNFSDTTASNRFFITITLHPSVATAVVSNPMCKNSANGYIIASSSMAGPWDYYWKDSTGHVIKTAYNKSTTDTLKNLSTGFYHLDITSSSACSNESKDITLYTTSPSPVSAFNVSSDSININSNIPLSFTNNSTNATVFQWNFGDGQTSTTLHASHSYAFPGNYQVVLSAINPACNDTTKSVRYIKAYTGLISTGVNDNTDILKQENIIVTKSNEGVTIDLNGDLNSQNVNIDIYNLLGQKLINTVTIEANTRKTNITLQTNESLLIVNIRSNNKTITKKLFNK